LTEMGGLLPAFVSVDDPCELRRRNKKMATPATTTTPAVPPTTPPTGKSLEGEILRTVGDAMGVGPHTIGNSAGDEVKIVVGGGTGAHGAKMGNDVSTGAGVTTTTAVGLGVSNIETVAVGERVGAGTVVGVELAGKVGTGADGQPVLRV
jgi:hypothetical protein